VLYLDRICMSAALDSIQRDLSLTNTQMSYVLMSFTLAYGLFEVPTGRWGDRIGGRRVLTRVSLWWSVFTALTGACTGLWSLLAARFIFGAGEAGAFPNVARVLSRWFPDHERGMAQGILLTASQIGGALAPFVATILIMNIGWRYTFVVFGVVGVAWAAGFWIWFRDDPATHPAVNEAEVAHIGVRVTSSDVHAPIPWKAVRGNVSIWFLSIIMTLASFNSYIYFSWFPKYLKAARGISASDAGLMSSIVLSLAACGTFLGGLLLGRVLKSASLTGRRLMGGVAFFSAAVALACALLTSNAWLATLAAAISCFFAQTTVPLWWSSAIGISGRHVGALFGLMNSCGVIGALASQYLVGALADILGARGFQGRQQWDPIFYIDIVALTLAGLLWASFRFVTVEPLEDSNTKASIDEALGEFA
jgi:MFS family permease